MPSGPPVALLTFVNSTPYNATITYSGNITTCGTATLDGGTCGASPATLGKNGGTCVEVAFFEAVTNAAPCTDINAFTATAVLQGTGSASPPTYTTAISAYGYFDITTFPDSNVVPITIQGAEQSTTTTVPAKAATASLTVQQGIISAQPETITPGREAVAVHPEFDPIRSELDPAHLKLNPIHSELDPVHPNPITIRPTGKGSVTVVVGSYKATAVYPAEATPAIVAREIAAALNVSGSHVKATASGAVVTITSIATGSGANLAFSATGNRYFKVLPSGSALAGGADATTTTKYDTGLVNLTTNGVTASAQWGEGATAATVAAALAASVNQVASAYWTASASGDVVTLTSVSSLPTVKGKSALARATPARSPVRKTADTTTSSPVSLTVSDTAGFTPASFNAATN